jgi:hypothetical protein
MRTSYLFLMVEELNNLFPVKLSTNVVCDRIVDNSVFVSSAVDHTDLVLISANHLATLQNISIRN